MDRPEYLPEAWSQTAYKSTSTVPNFSSHGMPRHMVVDSDKVVCSFTAATRTAISWAFLPLLTSPAPSLQPDPSIYLR
jgi:hypothetical protein